MVYHQTSAVVLATVAVAIFAIFKQARIGLVGSLALLLLEIPVCVAVFRLTLHPLANLPGPLLAAISDFYTVYHCLTGSRHLDFDRQHQKYGTVFRYGPNRVSVCSAPALNDIYGMKANTQRSQLYAAFMHFFTVPASLTTIDKRLHRFKRSITTKALNPAAVLRLQDLILRNVKVFTSLLQSKTGEKAGKTEQEDNRDTEGTWTGPYNMSRMFTHLLFDIMGDVTFSNGWEVQTSDKNRTVLDLLPLGTTGINLAGHVPSLLKLKLERVLFPNLIHGIDEFKKISQNQANWRIALKNTDVPHRDLFQSLLEAKDPETGEGYTQVDLIAEAGFLIIAGSDTTASALASTTFYLMHNPEAMRKARAEVERVFYSDILGKPDPETVIMGGKLKSCKYLAACIEEALRVSPSLAGILPREVLSGGLKIDLDNGQSLFLPAGVDVGVPIYPLHHSERYHPDPHAYHPERWIEGAEWNHSESGQKITTTADNIFRARAGFTAFGWGRTSCVGKHLAYQEMLIVMARLLLMYDMRVKDGSKMGEGAPGLGAGRHRVGEFQLKDTFTSVTHGPELEFRKRVWDDELGRSWLKV